MLNIAKAAEVSIELLTKVKVGDLVSYSGLPASILTGIVVKINEMTGRATVFWPKYNEFKTPELDKLCLVMKTMDLHRFRHTDVEDAVATFLNWTEMPCRIITGNSERMKKIVRKIVADYGYKCYPESAYNDGALIVVEDLPK